MNHRLLLAATLILISAGCRAVQSSSSDLEVAAATNYIFRGLVMNDGFGAETQGQIVFNRADGSSISGYAWGYLDLSGDPGDGAIESESSLRFSRLDIGARWSRTFDTVSMSGGVASYNFPNTTVSGTSELFVSAELTEPWYRPRAAVYYDFQNADDMYLRLGVHPQYRLDRALTAEWGLDIGYMGGGQSEFYYGVNSSGVSDLLASATASYRRDEYFRAFARIGLSKVLADELKDQVNLNGYDDTNIWLSVGFGWSY